LSKPIQSILEMLRRALRLQSRIRHKGGWLRAMKSWAEDIAFS
jgi:hypothetical protein